MKTNIKIIIKKIEIIILLSLLIFLIYPVLGAETVRKENYADPVIKVNDRIYIFNESSIVLKSGDKVVISYEIRPKTDDDAKIIDNRWYIIITQLQDPNLEIEITYENGAVVYENKPDFYIPDADELGGVRLIVINLTGTIPTVLDRVVEMPIMEVKVQDSEGDPLCPVVVVVVNTSKFMEDIRTLKDRVKKLESEATKLNIVNRYIKLASNNVTLAESYFKEGEFIKADKCLNYVETNLIKAKFEIEKAKAMRKYEEVKRTLNEVENLIKDVESLIQSAKEKGKNVAVYELELSKIKVKYEEIVRSIIDIENNLEAGKFKEAIKLANSTLEDVNSVIHTLNNISADLEKLVYKSPTNSSINSTNNNIFSDIIKDNFFIIIGGAVVGLTILCTIIISKMRKKRKWDELK